MRNRIISAMLIVAGLINFYPVLGVLSAAKLQELYGLDFKESNLLILMRHRALLFGLLGAFLLYSAMRPAMRGAALVAGLISMLGFVILAWQVGDYNASLHRVVLADVVASVALVAAGALHLLKKGEREGSAENP